MISIKSNNSNNDSKDLIYEEELKKIRYRVLKENELLRRLSANLWNKIQSGDITIYDIRKVIQDGYTQGFLACEQLHSEAENDTYELIGFDK